MGAKSNGGGFFQIENPDEAAVNARYRKAIVEALAVFESAVKLAVKAHDATGLKSLKAEAAEMFQQADNTLKQGRRRRRLSKKKT